MPALPALLLSIHFSSFLLVTMAPRSGSQAALLSSVRMGECPSFNQSIHPSLLPSLDHPQVSVSPSSLSVSPPSTKTHPLTHLAFTPLVNTLLVSSLFVLLSKGE